MTLPESEKSLNDLNLAADTPANLRDYSGRSGAYFILSGSEAAKSGRDSCEAGIHRTKCSRLNRSQVVTCCFKSKRRRCANPNCPPKCPPSKDSPRAQTARR
jgi:hypothetical protein